MNSNKDSTIFCQALGTNLALEQAKLYKTNAKRVERAASKDEFVKEKSKPPEIVSGISLMIVNCSRGEKNICLIIFLN